MIIMPHTESIFRRTSLDLGSKERLVVIDPAILSCMLPGC
jgi:hypothetical protein